MKEDKKIYMHGRPVKPEQPAHYYRRGHREFFMVSPEKIIKVLNKEFVSFITIAHGEESSQLRALVFDGPEDGTSVKITVDEFKAQFNEAARLILLDSEEV